MNLLSALLLISFCFSQYNYSLEDVNETSPYYGDSIGVSFFEGSISLHYFGYFT